MEPALARMIPRGPRRLPFRIILLCAAIAACVAEGPPPETSGPCPPGDCRIELEHVVRITDADEPGILPTSIVWPQETEAGTFVSASLDGTQIAEFGLDGRLTGVIGRARQGPGEFLRLRTLIPGPGDTLFAPDMSILRHRRTAVSPGFESHPDPQGSTRPGRHGLGDGSRQVYPRAVGSVYRRTATVDPDTVRPVP